MESSEPIEMLSSSEMADRKRDRGRERQELDTRMELEIERAREAGIDMETEENPKTEAKTEGDWVRRRLGREIRIKAQRELAKGEILAGSFAVIRKQEKSEAHVSLYC
jgi:type II secretory pathway component HofQ